VSLRTETLEQVELTLLASNRKKKRKPEYAKAWEQIQKRIRSQHQPAKIQDASNPVDSRDGKRYRDKRLNETAAKSTDIMHKKVSLLERRSKPVVMRPNTAETKTVAAQKREARCTTFSSRTQSAYTAPVGISTSKRNLKLFRASEGSRNPARTEIDHPERVVTVERSSPKKQSTDNENRTPVVRENANATEDRALSMRGKSTVEELGELFSFDYDESGFL